jgi:hypothetical protein
MSMDEFLEAEGHGYAIRLPANDSRSQEAGVGAGKRLEGTVREDTRLVNETEWPAMVCGRMSHGKYHLMDVCQMFGSGFGHQPIGLHENNPKNPAAGVDVGGGACSRRIGS